MRLALLLTLLFSAPAFLYTIGQLRPRISGYAAAGVSVVAFAAVWAIWISGGSAFTSSWAPSWNLELAFRLDGLAAAYALIAAGIACVVAVYSLQYMPAHLRHAGRPERDLARFHALLLLFMAGMIGLVTTRELYSLIVFWDLTAVVSFLLIGTDRDDADAQRSAVMALVVTAGSAVPLVVAAVLLHAHTGCSLIDDVHTAAIPPAILTAAVACILVAAVAKSAQAPLHFWLPRAMVAPTPVSAYLHSAAMVAAGVFLISRLYPLLARSDITGPALITIGGASVLTGSVMALAAGDVKRVLACSTIAQYGSSSPAS
jgi:multicomponent Na+:H+ antiporter subunit A